MLPGHTDREISLRNPDSDTEWAISKPMSAEKYHTTLPRRMNGIWNGPREITKPIERQTEEDEMATTIAVSEREDSGRHSDEGGGISLRIQSENNGRKTNPNMV